MAEDLTGKKFHRLTVVGLHSTKRVGKKRPRPEYMWSCQCECGEKRIVSSCHLRSGHNKSCGCLKTELQRKKEPNAAQIHAAWLAHKRGANQRGHINFLTKDEWYKITQQPCIYCGDKNTNQKKPDPRNQWGESFLYNGIDRLDNNGDYTFNNSVPCCGTCNYMKWRLTVDNFVNQCKKVVNYERISHERKSF